MRIHAIQAKCNRQLPDSVMKSGFFCSSLRNASPSAHSHTRTKGPGDLNPVQHNVNDCRGNTQDHISWQVQFHCKQSTAPAVQNNM